MIAVHGLEDRLLKISSQTCQIMSNIVALPSGVFKEEIKEIFAAQVIKIAITITKEAAQLGNTSMNSSEVRMSSF